MTENLCGSCVLCCKILAVRELDKPQDAWCRHCDKGVGCTIYETRPQSCVNFECVWLQSQKIEGVALPDWMKPNRSRVMLTAGNGGNDLVAYPDPGFPLAWREPHVLGWLQTVAKSGTVIIVKDPRGRPYAKGRVYQILGDGWEELKVRYEEDGSVTATVQRRAVL